MVRLSGYLLTATAPLMRDKLSVLLAYTRAIGFTAAFSVAISFPAHAVEMTELLGVWEQIASNAGPCPTCRIEFQATRFGAVVVANNGWRADLPALDTGGPADGFGRWNDERVAAWVAGRTFTVSFRLAENGLLMMTMKVDAGAGRQPIVKGSYRRRAAGSPS